MRTNSVAVQGLAGPSEIVAVDVSTDEGYPFVEKLDLDHVPVAYYEGRQCRLLVDEESRAITVDCSGDGDEGFLQPRDPESPGETPG